MTAASHRSILRLVLLGGLAAAVNAGDFAWKSPAAAQTYAPPTQLGGDGDDLTENAQNPRHPDDIFGEANTKRIRGLGNVKVAAGGDKAARTIFDLLVRGAHDKTTNGSNNGNGYDIYVEKFVTQQVDGKPDVDTPEEDPRWNLKFNSSVCAVLIDPTRDSINPNMPAKPLTFKYAIFYNVHEKTGLSWINYIHGDPSSKGRESFRIIFLNRHDLHGQNLDASTNYQGMVPVPPIYSTGSTPSRNSTGTICDVPGWYTPDQSLTPTGGRPGGFGQPQARSEPLEGEGGGGEM